MAVGPTTLSTTAPRTSRRHINRDLLLAIVVLTPSIIAVAIFIYTFIAWTFWISTVNWNTSVIDYTFVGLRNWERMLSSFRFQMNLRNLALYALGFMSQCIIIGFLLASLLDQHIKGEAVFRTIFIFPFAVSAVVTGVAWRWLMRPETGINLLFESVGLGFLKSKWFADPTWGILFITIASSWQFAGYVMALYLAGLRGIPSEVKEAAQIDGCNTWALYRHIIIPMLAPVTYTSIVLTGMGAIRVFDIVTVISGSGQAFSTDMLAYHMFEQMFTANRFSLSAVIGAFMIILSVFLVVPYLLSVRKEQER
ncbi:MAG: sugar ABC transporter permease [Anaerolineae bacterium]|nr:sugar ABC transporter permease [Candidatus Roseilinea sp.]MDW8451749.1 sugar ABC transporter permease [Anaerolineae bacterium]